MVATTSGSTRTGWPRLGDLLPGTILALVMVWCVAQSIASAGWADGIEILPLAALPAFVLGVITARIVPLPWWLAHPLSLLTAVVWSVQLAGAALVARTSEEFGPQLAARLTTWSDYASELIIRGAALTRLLQAGGRGEDTILFVLTLTLAMWLLGYLVAWLVFRSGWAWLAGALCLIVALLNYAFASPKPSDLFFLLLTAALLLVVQRYVVAQQTRWLANGVEFPDLLGGRFLIAAGLFCIIAIPLTGALPGFSAGTEVTRLWQVIRSPFVSAREGWQDAFSTINAPAGTSGSFVTRNARVGGARVMGDSEVLRVRSAEYEYWRAVTFDRYVGRLWQNTVGERAREVLGVATAEEARSPLRPGQVLAQPAVRGHERVVQTFEVLAERSDDLLLTGGQLRTSSVPVRVQSGYAQIGGEELPNFGEISEVAVDGGLALTRSYTVEVYLSQAGEAELRDAGTTYPDWVRAHYLQLPEALPARVGELAATIVRDANATNAYDQSVAIQSYLRTLTYDETRSAPPDDRDWVDYFLFDSKVGYCDDFASAMIVMLRTQGIPARLAQGYAGGTLNPELGAYVVRESMTHSWPEVYFLEYGWQRFEPTAAPYTRVPSRPAFGSTADSATGGQSGASGTDYEAELRRMMEENANGADSGLTLEELNAEIAARQRAAQIERALPWVLGGLTLLLIAGGVVGALWWDTRGLSPAAAIFGRITRLGRLAGVSAAAQSTPYEYGKRLAAAIPDEHRAIHRLVDAYVGERYARAKPDPQDLLGDWRAVRPALLAVALRRLIPWRRG